MARPQITVKLSESEQDSLKKIAREHHCITDQGQPSLRPLMRDIANGRLIVSQAGKKKGGIQ